MLRSAKHSENNQTNASRLNHEKEIVNKIQLEVVRIQQ